MADKIGSTQHDTIGAWTKQCYLAGRAAMDDALRPFDLGATQWYVLYQLVNAGPTRQRELQRILQVERATLSTVVIALVRKQLVEQIPDSVDQRQKMLRITDVGEALWRDLPDLTQIHAVAFDGIGDEDIETAIRVLRTATERLEQRQRTEQSRRS
ncbi:MarR family winged helix-turn-helix transcriptional regulator [Mycolicibacterium diernhoferi]|uniref:MarR family transcriptional regulator n=2 Tax=Mycolicibacterium diernhoferi TaxID=1801 RepID=A0A1Q4H7V5_9MYCO|nr:MarR family transcriptional regulator [Mycolicibacterium diernhoferi]OJZ63624.1 MarR family transcriptional regulator [Mycolicibacterium diernhoferi]OPE47475.1 MarR family transcriptional regulator [Mycolicibacterium diernhoferi]